MMPSIRQNTRAQWRAWVIAAALVAASAASAAAQTIAIVGGKVFPVSSAPIEHGTVLIRNGKIAAVGANVAVPAGAERIDATGKWVTPGLVNSATDLGVDEIGAVTETRDAHAKTATGIAAGFRVIDGFNPRSVHIQGAREAGVTTAVVLPSGGLIAGQAAVMDLSHGTAASMTLEAPAVMVGELGNSEQVDAGARGEVVERLRELIEDTRAFARNRSAYDRGATRHYAASLLDLEAMVPVVQGKLPLLVTTDRASDIEEALSLAKEYGLKIMIEGGAEAWMVADELAAAKVPVLTGAMNNIPNSFAELGSRQENAALLRKAGVQVVLIGNAGSGGEGGFNAGNIRYEAGNAVAYGMSWDDALRAITLAPAQVFGVADRVGSLAPGREANVVVWSGDPFEFSTTADDVFIRGNRVTGKSRRELLVERYKTLPPNYDQP
ncbi:MAG TPA: amidohydrolase family protein [Gemmatimonadaceae bacterium]|nr:amidohydrolase family protein [Gemmatimonadaceae bacterium]